MPQENCLNDCQTLEDIFQVIQNYHQLALNELLKKIIQEKEVSIPELFKRLQNSGYYLSIESLYRYFSSSPKSNRFPPQEFIVVYSEVLQLTDEQTQLILHFWKYSKMMQRCDCSPRMGA